VFLEAWCVRTKLRGGGCVYQEEGVREGVMGMCGRLGCAMFLSLGGSFPALCSLFSWFCLKKGFWSHVSLKTDGATSCTFVCVRVICVR
jgi:hypothetical protein